MVSRTKADHVQETLVLAKQLSKRMTGGACATTNFHQNHMSSFNRLAWSEHQGEGGQEGGMGCWHFSSRIIQAASTLYACPCLAGQLEHITHDLGHDRTGDEKRREREGDPRLLETLEDHMQY